MERRSERVTRLPGCPAAAAAFLILARVAFFSRGARAGGAPQDGTGALDAEEVRQGLKRLHGVTLSVKEAQRLVQAADADGNSEVSGSSFASPPPSRSLVAHLLLLPSFVRPDENNATATAATRTTPCRDRGERTRTRR